MQDKISQQSFELARNLFKSQRESWQTKIITDKNGKQRKVRVAPESSQPKEVLSHKPEVREDADIVSSILHGTASESQRAKSELYEKHHKDAYRIIYTFIQGKGYPEEKELAEDLTSDAFVKALEDLHVLESEKNKGLAFKSWFTRICSNTARDYMRSMNSQIQQNAASDEEMAARMNSASEEPSPYDQAVANQKAQMIRDAVDKLPDAYKEPIKLFYFEELSADEVAEKLNISKQAVASRLQYARQMLRNLLDEELFKAVILYFQYIEKLNLEK